MNLIDVLSPDCVLAQVPLASKAEMLSAIAASAGKCNALANVETKDILQALEQREELGSTGFGKGIAIPHCRLPQVKEFVVGLITASEGVDFDAIDDQPVRLCAFIIGPQTGGDPHVRLLSAISQTLMVPGAVDELLAARNSQTLYESFLRHTRADISGEKQAAQCMAHVFVQDESLFEDILTALSGTEDGSIMVVNAQNTAMYLSRLPLFADFWSDKPGEFGRIINMVIDKRLVNETIRRIESVTGSLCDRSGVMVTVQELTYTAGSLDV